MISKLLSLCAVVALTNAGVITTGHRHPSVALNPFQPEFANLIANPSIPLTYQYPFNYPANLYPNLPQQYQYAPTNYPYTLAPLQYAPGFEELAVNEPVVYVEPVLRSQQHVIPEAIIEAKPEIEEKPHYLFAYSVMDNQTGDNKQHQESRDGDVVRGEYSLLESDGTLRRVEYIADPVKGFNAVVSRSKPQETEAKA
ncbi:cuticle protein 21-like [Pieris rapae]|uniref:cuticle protein 21-like n=1 Tax=Pieris rapae TaxID=64459 RepID=UPI001E27F479|nr:cuticle protein 21-like [Pieris rapae]